MNAYEKGLTIKSLVLLELRDKPMLGQSLVARVEERCSELGAQLEGFDFAGWVGTTIWGVFETFDAAGFITHSGRRPSGTHEWSTTALEISYTGQRFLQSVRVEAPHVLELLEGKEVAQRAVAS